MATNKPQPLAPKRETFAQALAAGRNQTDAFRLAFPNSATWKDSTVWSKASTLAADAAVKARVAELRERAAKAAVFTLADHLRNLETISLAALQAKDFNAAARAEEARGKASGFYVQRTELTGKDGGPIETKQTRDLTDEELDAELLRHGIDPESIKPRAPDARH